MFVVGLRASDYRDKISMSIYIYINQRNLPAFFVQRPRAAFVRDASVAQFEAAVLNRLCCMAANHSPPVGCQTQSASARRPGQS